LRENVKHVGINDRLVRKTIVYFISRPKNVETVITTTAVN